MNDIKLDVVARFIPPSDDYRRNVATTTDLARVIGEAMAHTASSFAARGTRGVAKRAAMLKTITDTIAGIDWPVGTPPLEDLVVTVELKPSCEEASIVIRKRTTLDAMKEAVCKT